MPATEVLRHPQLPPDVIHPQDLRTGEASPTVGDPDYAWHVLAEGDSWFTIGAVPSSNLLFELRLAKWTQVFNLAYPGDTMKHIGQLVENPDLRQWLAKPRFNAHFDALLLSAGGNDVIDAAPGLVSPTPLDGGPASEPASYVHHERLGVLLKDVQDGFARILALRDAPGSLSAGAPAFAHTYDYLTPRNAPARFLGTVPILGPWLYKAFCGSGLDVVLQQRIANLLVDALAEALLELDAEQGRRPLPALHVVDTRNTLVPANPAEQGRSNDWLNEIHPTLDGYRKLADRLSARINAVLLG